VNFIILAVLAQLTFPSPDSLIAAVDSAQQQITSMAGTITREITSLESPVTELYGKFYWHKQRYRLDFITPQECHVIFDGHRILINRPAEHEFTVKEIVHPLRASADLATPWFPSLQALKGDFAFGLVGHGEIEGCSVWVLEGTTPDTAKHPNRVMLWIDQILLQPLRVETYDGGTHPTSIYLIDSLAVFDSTRVPVKFRNWLGIGGDAVEVTTVLSGLRLNFPLPDDLFQIKLPQDGKN